VLSFAHEALSALTLPPSYCWCNSPGYSHSQKWPMPQFHCQQCCSQNHRHH